jgi:hypothetical protein
MHWQHQGRLVTGRCDPLYCCAPISLIDVKVMRMACAYFSGVGKESINRVPEV